MHKIILDTDVGSEMTDAAALVLAATAPEIELLGVSSVTHDSVFRASVAKKFLELVGKTNVLVSAGFGKASEHTWEKQLVFPTGYHPLVLDPRPGWRLILDLVDENAGDVILVGIGPTTNIAQALTEDPELPKKVSRLILMGGMIEPPVVDGKQIPRGFEYNFCNDSTSAEKILKAGFNLTILPGDITFQQNDPWTDGELTQLTGIRHSAVELLIKLKNRSLVAMKAGMQKSNLPMEFAKPWVNDEFVITYLIEPELFETKNLFLEWELPDKYPRLIPSDTGYPVRVVEGIDFMKARAFIINRLQRCGTI